MQTDFTMDIGYEETCQLVHDLVTYLEGCGELRSLSIAFLDFSAAATGSMSSSLAGSSNTSFTSHTSADMAAGGPLRTFEYLMPLDLIEETYFPFSL